MKTMSRFLPLQQRALCTPRIKCTGARTTQQTPHTGYLNTAQSRGNQAMQSLFTYDLHGKESRKAMADFTRSITTSQLISRSAAHISNDDQSTKKIGGTDEISLDENGYRQLARKITGTDPFGVPIDYAVRHKLQRLLGLDLSQVLVHTGPTANQIAEALNARAFAVGRNIYFSRGSYNTSGTSGLRLLAHEVVHVAQQAFSRTNGESPAYIFHATSSTLEREAHCTSQHIERALGIPTHSGDQGLLPLPTRVLSGDLIQRQPEQGVSERTAPTVLLELDPREMAWLEAKKAATPYATALFGEIQDSARELAKGRIQRVFAQYEDDLESDVPFVKFIGGAAKEGAKATIPSPLGAYASVAIQLIVEAVLRAALSVKSVGEVKAGVKSVPAAAVPAIQSASFRYFRDRIYDRLRRKFDKWFSEQSDKTSSIETVKSATAYAESLLSDEADPLGIKELKEDVMCPVGGYLFGALYPVMQELERLREAREEKKYMMYGLPFGLGGVGIGYVAHEAKKSFFGTGESERFKSAWYGE